MDTLSAVFHWLSDAYATLNSWRFSIGTILFWALLLLIAMMGSPRTARFVPTWFKKWVQRADRTDE